MLYQSNSRNFDNDVVDAEFEVGIDLVDRPAHLGGAFHVDLAREKEMRNGTQRRNQSTRNRTAHLTGWFVAICGRPINSGLSRLSRQRSQRWFGSGLVGFMARFAAHRRLDVFLYDATARAASLNRFEVDAGFGRYARGNWCNLYVTCG